jgi:hypothetical protein
MGRQLRHGPGCVGAGSTPEDVWGGPALPGNARHGGHWHGIKRLVGLSHLSLSNLGSGSEVPDRSSVKPVPNTLARTCVDGGPEPDEPTLPGAL